VILQQRKGKNKEMQLEQKEEKNHGIFKARGNGHSMRRNRNREKRKGETFLLAAQEKKRGGVLGVYAKERGKSRTKKPSGSAVCVKEEKKKKSLAEKGHPRQILRRGFSAK